MTAITRRGALIGAGAAVAVPTVGPPAALIQDAPQDEHRGTSQLHIPRKFLGGCEDPKIYMAPVEGDCLVPKITSGESVIVSPAAAPEPGDFIVIWPVKGKPNCKRLTFRLCPLSVPAPGSDSNVMPALVFEQINPERRYWLPMDKVRAVHKVIGTLKESADPGWREDGLYSVEFDRGFRAVDWIKVRTKKGALRKEPLGLCRYGSESGKRAWQVTLRLFESSAAADFERLAGGMQS